MFAGVDLPCINIGCTGRFRRIRLFADSNSDWLDDKWPIETLAAFLKEIHDAPNIDFLLLTKRPEQFSNLDTGLRIGEVMSFEMDNGRCGNDDDDTLFQWLYGWILAHRRRVPKNVWLGVSVENQAMADLRITQLLEIPAAVRFLSCEPLLEAVDLCLEAGSEYMCSECLSKTFPEEISTSDGLFFKCSNCSAESPAEWYKSKSLIDWVIVGGESGKNRRGVPVEAITDIADQCLAAGVPVYVKQDCAFKSGEQGRIPDAYWVMKQFPK